MTENDRRFGSVLNGKSTKQLSGMRASCTLLIPLPYKHFHAHAKSAARSEIMLRHKNWRENVHYSDL